MEKRKTSTYYPVYLDVFGKPCVIIGAGEVAARKAGRLAACGASVTVVGRQLHADISTLKRQNLISHVDADYDGRHIRGAFLVIGATDSEVVNDRIARDARALGIMVNIVDDPARCDFILPSVVQRGDLSIAVSTGGKSPALAKMLRQELEVQFGVEYGVLLDIMGRLREKILAGGNPSDANKSLFEAVVHSDILEAIREGDGDRIRRIILDRTGHDLPVE